MSTMGVTRPAVTTTQNTSNDNLRNETPTSYHVTQLALQTLNAAIKSGDFKGTMSFSFTGWEQPNIGTLSYNGYQPPRRV